MAIKMDHQQKIRSILGDLGRWSADIQLSESMEALVNQEAFLSNERNKSQFIALLSHHLKADNQIVHQSSGDDDTMIVACALEYATQGIEVTVIADDTDILILLIYHWRKEMANVEIKSSSKLWKVKNVVDKIGEALIIAHSLYSCMEWL